MAFDLPDDLTLTLGDDVEIRFRLIRPGRFRMGSRDGFPREEPVHWVELTEPYYLGVYPVTQLQWRALLERRPDLAGDLDRNPSEFKGGDRPVEQVRWDDCLRWCDVLTGCLMDGTISAPSVSNNRQLTATLPTEAQWEYACCGPSENDWATTAYHNGDGEAALAEIGWYGGNSELETQPVGRLEKNSWHLHDLHGNVWEWCWDDLDEDTYRLRVDGVRDPCNPARSQRWQDRLDTGANRVIRGGSWDDSPWGCRAAYRYWWWPVLRSGSRGFRVCLLAPGPVPSQADEQAEGLTSTTAGARRLAGAESRGEGQTAATAGLVPETSPPRSGENLA